MSQVPSLPPIEERASTRELRRQARNRRILAVVGALVLVAVAAVGVAQLRGGGVDEPIERFDPGSVAPVVDPEMHALVRDWCQAPDPELAAKVPAFVPGSVARTTVTFEQAIGAPGLRNLSFLLQVSPDVGAPQDAAAFDATAIDEVPLATCLQRREMEATDLRCTYTGDPTLGTGDETTRLMVTHYDLEVIEVRTGTVVARGRVDTDGSACPADALVELSDEVSGPMTPDLIAAWFAEHFADGQPS